MIMENKKRYPVPALSKKKGTAVFSSGVAELNTAFLARTAGMASCLLVPAVLPEAGSSHVNLIPGSGNAAALAANRSSVLPIAPCGYARTRLETPESFKPAPSTTVDSATGG